MTDTNALRTHVQRMLAAGVPESEIGAYIQEFSGGDAGGQPPAPAPAPENTAPAAPKAPPMMAAHDPAEAMRAPLPVALDVPVQLAQGVPRGALKAGEGMLDQFADSVKTKLMPLVMALAPEKAPAFRDQRSPAAALAQRGAEAVSRPADTTAGRYMGSVGEVGGGSLFFMPVMKGLGLLSTAAREAATIGLAGVGGQAAEDAGLPRMAGELALPISAGAAARTGRGLSRVLSEVFPTADAVKADAAAGLRALMLGDEGAAMQGIDDALARTQGTDMRPMLGESTGDAGILDFQGRMKGSGDRGLVMQREQANRAAIHDFVDETTPQGSPALMQERLAANRVALEGASQQAVTDAADAMHIATDLAAPDRSQAAVGAAARQQVEAQRGSELGRIRQQFSSAADGDSLDVTAVFASAPDKFAHVMGGKWVSDMQQAMAKAAKAKQPFSVMVDPADAQTVLNLLKADIRGLEAGALSPTKGTASWLGLGRLRPLADELGGVIDDVGARSAYGDLKRTYESGGVGRATSRDFRGVPDVPDERFVQTATGDGRNLGQAITAAGGKAGLVDELADTLRNEYQAKVLRNGEGFSQQGHADFMARNQRYFDQFPELAEEFGNVAAKQSAHAEAATARDGALRAWDAEFGRIIGADPGSAVGGAMGASDGVQRLQSLAAQVKGHPEAENGLRNAVFEWVKDKGGMSTGRDRFAPERLSRALVKYRDHLEAAGFAPDHLERVGKAGRMIDLYQDSISNTQLRGRSGTSAEASPFTPFGRKGDSTSSKVANAGSNLVKYFLLQKTMTGAQRTELSGFAGKMVDMLARRTARASDLLTEMMLDPELAKTMLMEHGPGTAKVLDRRARAWLASSAAREVGEDDNERR